ncbi:hypothetical protein [Sphingopyxis sp. GW247-27LB]|uniref:hypothetical protein n=1 Tax=Sphingopyxis sp. GW247-27LB TaxID=2012632 RepID=UPI001140CCD4|nr:hypothetical protein [Sphingopyxis sp. GW247-27LB]
MDIDTPEGRREMALTILRDHSAGLSWQCGSFLGQLCVSTGRPLSEKQAAWLDRIIDRAGLADEVAT